MADTQNDQQDPSDDLDGISEDDAKRLLNRPAGDDKPDDEDDDDPEGADQLGDAGQRALDSIKASRQKARDRAAAEKKRADDLAAKVREFETAGQSESERLQNDRESFKSRAEKAEDQLKRWQIAIEAAPDGASLDTVRKVAKRLSGTTDDELNDDAQELWADFAPAPKTSVPSKPKERLRGGGAPDEGPDESDPRKLAAQLPRAR